MGRISRNLLVLLMFLITGAAQAAPSNPAPSGKSSQLGIAFQVEGGTRWCADVVHLSLSSKTAFRQQSEEFQQMIGRIRGIIQGECSQVRTIGIATRVKGYDVGAAEIADFTSWRYLSFPAEQGRLYCAGPENPQLCSQRWGVFWRLRELLSNEGFRRVQLTTYLHTDSSVDAEFKYADAEGRVRFLPIPQDQQAPPPLDLVKRQIDGLAVQCSGTFQKSEADTLGAGSAGQSLTCTTGNETRRSYFVIHQIGTSGFDVMAFTDFTTAGLAGDQLYSLIKSVLLKVPSPDSKWDRIYDDTFGGLAIPNLATSSCGQVAVNTGAVSDKMVAVRLRPAANRAGQFILQVMELANAKPDPWQMNLGADADAAKSASSLASWLIFKAVPNGTGYYFENQLVGINARNECTVLTAPVRIGISQMPLRAVQLYTVNFGLPISDDDSAYGRDILESWRKGHKIQTDFGNLCERHVAQVNVEQDKGQYRHPMRLRPDAGANGEIPDSIWNESLREQKPKSLTLTCIYADKSWKEIDVTGAREIKWYVAKGIVTKQ